MCVIYSGDSRSGNPLFCVGQLFPPNNWHCNRKEDFCVSRVTALVVVSLVPLKILHELKKVTFMSDHATAVSIVTSSDALRQPMLWFLTASAASPGRIWVFWMELRSQRHCCTLLAPIMWCGPNQPPHQAYCRLSSPK